MSAASNYLEDKLLDHVLRSPGAAFTAPSTLYVALFADNTAVPAAAAALEGGTSSTGETTNWGYYEINNASYERRPITFAAAGLVTTGTIASNATVTFPVASADYQTAGTTGNIVTHLAIIDDSTPSNVLFYGALTTPKTVSSGDQFTISTGNLSIALA